MLARGRPPSSGSSKESFLEEGIPAEELEREPRLGLSCSWALEAREASSRESRGARRVEGDSVMWELKVGWRGMLAVGGGGELRGVFVIAVAVAGYNA